MRNGVMLLLTALSLSAALPPVPAWSQFADEMEAALLAPEISYAAAARFVLEAADVAALAPEEAFRLARERQWLPERAAPEEAARLGAVSLLIMRAFALKGGLLYSFFPNAHFAYRELSHKQVIRDRADPEMTVSGDGLLFMLGRVIALQSGAGLPGGVQ